MLRKAEGPIPDDPKTNAERLLMEVLPADCYIALAAHGSFTVDAKRNRYRLFKGRKTELEGLAMAGPKWSACIHPSDTECPDADRIVAEYLMIRNDEEQYLKIANLTEIGNIGGMAQRFLVDAAIEAMRLTPRMPWVGGEGRIGETIQVRLPARYNTQITLQMIVQEALHLLVRHERLRGIRLQPMMLDEVRHSRAQVRRIDVDMNFNNEDLSLAREEFVNRYVRTAVERMVELIGRERGLYGIVEFPIPGGTDGAIQRDPESGWVITLAHAYDIMTNRMLCRMTVGLVIHP